MFATLALLLASPLAQADDRALGSLQVDTITSSPLQIELMAQLDVPPERAFELVSEEIPSWFKAIPSLTWDTSASATENMIDVGAVRTCEFGGATLFEEIQHWDDSLGADGSLSYAYRIDQERSTAKAPINSHMGVMMVASDGEGGSVLTWRQYYKRNVSIMAPMVNFGLRSQMSGALDELVMVAAADKPMS